MQAYGRMAKNRTMEVDAAEIRIRAERRLGEMLSMQKAAGGLNTGARCQLAGKGSDGLALINKKGQKNAPKLAQAGITYDLSSRAQTLAAVPEEQFEAEIGTWRDRVKGEGVRITARLVKAGDKVIKKRQEAQALSERMPVDTSSDEELDEQGLTRADVTDARSPEEIIEDLAKEVEVLNERIEAMCSEDLPKKIKEQQMEIYGLRGRINQLLFTEKSTQELLKYNANQLHKLRKIFGANTHKELIAAAQAAQAAYAQAQVA